MPIVEISMVNLLPPKIARPAEQAADHSSSGRRRLAIGLAVSALLLNILATSSGIIGCLPWDWNKCLCDRQQYSEYSQTFQHDAENVSQISLAVAWEPVRPFQAQATEDDLMRKWAKLGGFLVWLGAVKSILFIVLDSYSRWTTALEIKNSLPALVSAPWHL
jgi:hypothetical protein